ncbi:MAG: hypothetical protein M1832_005962 [Thelocarpon impressellum]|nr:MAG: hypothetical protein M1832_005962 [Thelocarpon impressellum]
MYSTLSSGSSAGSNVFACAAVSLVSLLVLLLLRHYLPLRTTPAYLLVPIFLGLALPASIILLVPIDLASSSGVDSVDARGIWLPERVVLVAWRIAYWLCFSLTWAILPLLGEYADSGDRSPKQRLLYSLRSNARYQLAVFGSCAVGLVYFSLQSGVKVTDIKALVVALAYCWGLVLAIYLMGHGLVAIPRRCFRDASVSGTLRRIQSSAPVVHDKLQDAVQEVEQLEAQVAQLRRQKSGAPRDLQDWIEDLADLSEQPEARLAGYSTATLPMGEGSVPTIVTKRYLADLTRHVTRARHKKARFIAAWDVIVADAARTQAILDSAASKALDFGRPSQFGARFERIAVRTPYVRHLLHVRILPALRCLLGALFSLASVCIVWSEVVKYISPRLSIINYTVVHHPNSTRGQIGFPGQVVAAAWISYMCAAALTSLGEAKVWGNRALVRRNTYAESACWYASQTAKLTVPLAYNFVTFLPREMREATTFHQFLGRLIILTPLGRWFDILVPIFVLVPVSATLFGLYGKIGRLCGLADALEGEDDVESNPSGYGTGGWREGRELIERELSLSAASSSSALGLERRSGPARLPTIANNPRNLPPPALSVPDVPSNSSSPTASRSGLQQQQRPTRAPIVAAASAEGEDDNAFSEFAHRVKNTFDAVEAPRWMQNIGDGFKKPKWMSLDDEEDESREARGGIGRWFGSPSSSGEGRLRL